MSETATGTAVQRAANDSSPPFQGGPPDGAQPAPMLRTAVTRGRVLIIVENLPCPFDRRVWQEARTLAAAGYLVSIICPKAPGYERSFEQLDGIDIHRHSLPQEADGLLGYALEYSWALAMEFMLSLKVLFGRGFDVIHACNPPDTIFLIGAFYKLLGKRFVFDHHDINPELYEAKFGKRGFGQKLLLMLEKLTFRTADMVISTNESYRRIAIGRGGVDPRSVFVVRSGPTAGVANPLLGDHGATVPPRRPRSIARTALMPSNRENDVGRSPDFRLGGDWRAPIRGTVAAHAGADRVELRPAACRWRRAVRRHCARHAGGSRPCRPRARVPPPGRGPWR